MLSHRYPKNELLIKLHIPFTISIRGGGGVYTVSFESLRSRRIEILFLILKALVQ